MKYLAELRQKAGYSQSELGRALGISQAAISYYEAGGRMPSYRQYIKYKKFFKNRRMEFNDDKLYNEFGVPIT